MGSMKTRSQRCDKKSREICHKIELVYDFWPSGGQIFSKKGLLGRKSGSEHLKTVVLS